MHAAQYRGVTVAPLGWRRSPYDGSLGETSAAARRTDDATPRQWSLNLMPPQRPRSSVAMRRQWRLRGLNQYPPHGRKWHDYRSASSVTFHAMLDQLWPKPSNGRLTVSHWPTPPLGFGYSPSHGAFCVCLRAVVTSGALSVAVPRRGGHRTDWQPFSRKRQPRRHLGGCLAMLALTLTTSAVRGGSTQQLT